MLKLILLLLSLRTIVTIFSSGVKKDTFGKVEELDEKSRMEPGGTNFEA